MTAVSIKFDGYVLAGGLSRRMGTPKPDLEFEGTTLLQRAVRTLQAFCPEVAVVGTNFLSSVDVPVIQDLPITPQISGMNAPLCGLYTALAHARREWIVVLACDLPFVGIDLLEHLGIVAEESIQKGDEPDAIVPVQSDGCHQPLAAIYRRGSCLAAARIALSGNDLSLRSYLTRIRFVEYQPFERSEQRHDTFHNINRPSDLESAKMK